MAFCCVLYLKEECDGCGICEDRGRSHATKKAEQEKLGKG